jgi:putative ABC transport system permease protein
MVLADLRYAFRMLRLRAASSAAIVLTLAIAIGANSALFTLIDAALLTPLPVEQRDRLVNIYTTAADGSGYNALSYPDYRDLREAIPALEDVLGYSGLMTTVSSRREGSSDVIFGELVTANYFFLLGVTPQLGRAFARGDDERGAPPVVVIGDRFWRRRFNADPAVIGRQFALNGRPCTIVGVAPRDFGGLLFRAMFADVWAPVSMMGSLRTDHLDDRGERWMFVKGRLKPGSTVAAASAASAVIANRLQSDYAATNKGRAFRVLASSDVFVHPDGDRAIIAASGAVMAAAFLVLLVGCANVVGVMLSRSGSR